MIPSVTPDRNDKPVVEPSWITVKEPKAAYSVGEQLEVTVPKDDSKRLNYMVSLLGYCRLSIAGSFLLAQVNFYLIF